MKEIIELEYLKKAVVAYFLDGSYNVYPLFESEKLGKYLYIPDELTVVERIKSKEQAKEIKNIIKFYFDNDTVEWDYNYYLKKK